MVPRDPAAAQGLPSEVRRRIGQTRPVDDVVVERVLRAVEQVPRGRVVSYGDVAALVGIGPRQVGTIMRLYGSNVTWWRVTSSSGDLPVPLMDEVRERWATEGILLKPNGRGCRIAEYRADLARLGADYERATADLGG
jgi:methylated-DNA-protein-cysteine methyltransferase-like protein